MSSRGPIVSLKECACRSGVALNDMVIGLSPSERHFSLLQSYLFGRPDDGSTLQDRIIEDMRDARNLGASRRAADLLLVLRIFMSMSAESSRRRDLAGQPIHLWPKARGSSPQSRP
jgi:hypothetical protein